MPVEYKGKSFALMLNEFKALRQKFPTIVGTEAVNFFKGSFDRQGFVEDRKVIQWKPRSTDNVIKVRKGKTLVKSGRLRRSIRITYKSAGLVKVGTDVVYARIHNEGGEITQVLTPKQVRYFWYLYKAYENEAFKNMALAKEIKITIPKRQFMGQSKFLNDRLSMILTREINKIFNQ